MIIAAVLVACLALSIAIKMRVDKLPFRCRGGGAVMNIGDSYEVRDNSGKFLWTGSIVKITRKWFYLQEPTVGAHIHFRQSDGRSVMTVDGGLWASPAANPTA